MKQFINNFLILSYIIVVLNGCNKSDLQHFIIKGKVINAGSRLPIDSVSVTISDGFIQSSDGFSIDNLSPTTSSKWHLFTQKDGTFSIEVDAKFSPTISAGKKGYSFYKTNNKSLTGTVMFANTGGADSLIIELVPKAYFNGVFQNSLPSNKDTFCFANIPYDIYGENDTYFRNLKTCFYGEGPFKASKYSDEGKLAYGDMYFRYVIEYTKSGKRIVEYDSVYIKAFETFSDTIIYNLQ